MAEARTLTRLDMERLRGEKLTLIDFFSCCAGLTMSSWTSLVKRSSHTRSTNLGVMALTCSETWWSERVSSGGSHLGLPVTRSRRWIPLTLLYASALESQSGVIFVGRNQKC